MRLAWVRGVPLTGEALSFGDLVTGPTPSRDQKNEAGKGGDPNQRSFWLVESKTCD